MLKSFLLFILITSFATGAFAQYRYACFKSDSHPATQLTVCFKKNKAVYIKFKGQKRNIPLHFTGSKQTDNASGDPPFFWTETYTILTGKRITASSIFTNGGAYELELTYINNKTKIKQRFSIIETLAGENFSPYRNVPCF